MATVTAPLFAESAAPARPVGWAAAGVLAGLAGVVSIGASMSVDAVYTSEGSASVVEEMAKQVPNILVFHFATLVMLLAVVVFGAGLHRRLRAQAPAESVLPTVALGGLWLVAVAGLLGTGLNTEFIFGLSIPEARETLSPEVVVVYGHWIATIPWLWVGAGLAAAALAVAALRHAAAPRWIGWVSAVLGGLTLLLGVSPLQYMAGFTGPVWLTVTALGFLVADRSGRA